jgi:hypothetical protein
VDDDAAQTAYVVYSAGFVISIERLTSDHTDSTQESSPIFGTGHRYMYMDRVLVHAPWVHVHGQVSGARTMGTCTWTGYWCTHHGYMYMDRVLHITPTARGT